MDWYIKVLENYTVSKGRARRKEYWMFVLFNLIVGIVLNIITGVLHTPMYFSYLYSLVTFLPSVMVGIRRMHDTNHCGWWILLPIVNLIFLVIDGDSGPNFYGPDPKGRSPITTQT